MCYVWTFARFPFVPLVDSGGGDAQCPNSGLRSELGSTEGRGFSLSLRTRINYVVRMSREIYTAFSPL